MYQPEDYFRKKKRSYLLPTLLIALLLGIYLGGDINGWWGKTASGSSPAVKSDKVAEGPRTDTLKPTTVVSTDQLESPKAVSEPPPVAEIRAPDFALPDLYDEEVTYILSQYQGQPVILNFWASWCAPCRVEMPAFQAAHQQYETDGLVILAVNQTFIDDVEAAREFADEMGLTFPLLRDDDGRVSERLYQVRGLPTTVVIRPDGTVAFAQIGPMNDAQIADISRRLATGEAVP